MSGPRMRLRSAAGPVAPIAVAFALALSIGGCGSSGVVALDPVARAADATSRVGGAHIAITAQVEAAALSTPFTMSGGGFFNYRTHEGMLSLQMSGLPGAAATTLPPGPLQMEEIFKSSTIYVGSTLFAGKLPGGARWMKLDLSRFGQALGLNLEQLAGGQSNPAQFLEYLKASGGAVTVTGHELVGGVETTRYRGAIDLQKAAEVVPSSDRGRLRASLAKLAAQTGISSLPVEVWVDASGLVRRMSLALSFPASGESVQLRMRIELFGFGTTPAVAAPQKSEVFDATQTALGGLGAGGG
jgi:hypothetical protein